MDRNSIIILVLCGVFFVLWMEMTPRLFPPKPGSRTNITSSASVTNRLERTTNASTVIPSTLTNLPAFIPPAPGAAEELLVLANENARYTFTSHGGGLKLVELLKYRESVACGSKAKAATNRVATLNNQAQQPVLALTGSDALVGDSVFKLSRFSRPRSATNQASLVEGVRAEKLLANSLYLVKEFELTSNYLVTARVRFENRSEQPLALPPQQWSVGAATPLNRRDPGDDVGFHWYDGNHETTVNRSYFDNRTLGCLPGTPRTDYRNTSGKIIWATANNQFFFLALMPKEPATEIFATRYTLPPPGREEIAADHRTLTNQFAVQIALQQPATNVPPGQAVERQFHIYAGPKEYRTLERIGAEMKNDLDGVMGYGGFFGFFSRLLLLSTNGLNALGLSYGLAIIAITVIIKLLFWPLTQASTRSMKRMQALQPQMKALQEKYKDDPAKMNKKLMEFMRENKVSPLGGCLPLMLQIPVFIGFFQMVRTAIELRGARFLWACDLSKPDTVFVIPGVDFNVNPLPLLMGATMLWQARLTPPSPGMDPMQQKMMKYFPLIFLFMLYNYSAGLTLYWTVQNLLSIAQMKLTKTIQSKPGEPAKPAPAPPQPKKKK